MCFSSPLSFVIILEIKQGDMDHIVITVDRFTAWDFLGEAKSTINHVCKSGGLRHNILIKKTYDSATYS
jgi:hypothetical protein